MGGVILFGGHVAAAVAQALQAAGTDVTVVGCPPPQMTAASGVRWLAADLLTEDVPPLPDGAAVILLGSGEPRPRWHWLLPVSNALTTARILPALAGRRVLLMSSVDVYGRAPGPLAEDTPPELPWSIEQIDDWCDEAARLAREPCPPWRSAPAGRRMAGADSTGRRVPGLSRLAQERLVTRAAEPGLLTILRLAHVYGTGERDVIAALIRKALAGDPLRVPQTTRSFVSAGEIAAIIASGLPSGIYNVGGDPVRLPALAAEIRQICGSMSPIEPYQPTVDDDVGPVDTSRLAAAGFRIGHPGPVLEAMVHTLRMNGRPVFRPELPVVIPPRPALPDQVAARQQASLWNGRTKHGNRWSRELRSKLAEALGLGDDSTVLVTTSGTAALRLAIVAAAGPAAAGEAAILPSFTFPATAEVLQQLGYRLRFVDVDHRTWTMEPDMLRVSLEAGDAGVVVCVDTFGNACDYSVLRPMCDAAGVPLVADSAAAMGSRYQGRPVAAQASGHAYSMSFAKVLSAGGAGGAAVLPAEQAARILGHPAGWPRSQLMDELPAIFALDQLAVLDDLVRRRNRIADIYRDGLRFTPQLIAQEVRPGDVHSYVHWVMRVPAAPGRDAVARALGECGVQTKPYFRALHMAGMDGRRLPVTERLDAEVLALPMSSELTEEEAEQVMSAVRYCLATLPDAGCEARRQASGRHGARHHAAAGPGVITTGQQP
jgi:dTDP-4-amino-4,6-dideoxygalactose transaminase/nucleoside-diphosphate-sugar epimerase